MRKDESNTLPVTDNSIFEELPGIEKYPHRVINQDIIFEQHMRKLNRGYSNEELLYDDDRNLIDEDLIKIRDERFDEFLNKLKLEKSK